MKLPWFLTDVTGETGTLSIDYAMVDSGRWLDLLYIKEPQFYPKLYCSLLDHVQLMMIYDTDALGELCRECVDLDGLARNVHLSIVSVQMYFQSMILDLRCTK